MRIIHRTGYDAEGGCSPRDRSCCRRSSSARNARRPNTAEARLSRFFNSAPIGIAEIDSDGIIRNANLAFVSLSPKAQRGAPLSAIAMEPSQRQLREALQAARGGGGRSSIRST